MAPPAWTQGGHRFCGKGAPVLRNQTCSPVHIQQSPSAVGCAEGTCSICCKAPGKRMGDSCSDPLPPGLPEEFQQSIVKGQVKWVRICFTIVHILSVSPSALFIAKSIHEQGWCYVSLVFPVVLYGHESWTIKKAER